MCTGRIAPIDLGALDAGARLGLGKQQQDAAITETTGRSRKALAAEVQMLEDADAREQRLERVEAKALQQERVKAALRTLYCEARSPGLRETSTRRDTLHTCFSKP